MANKIPITNNTTSKNYDYAQGKVTLRFSLRTDIKQEMKDFLELLMLAQRQIEEDIKSNEKNNDIVRTTIKKSDKK